MHLVNAITLCPGAGYTIDEFFHGPGTEGANTTPVVPQ